MLELGTAIRDSTGLQLLDPVRKLKPDHLSRDIGDICLAGDGLAQGVVDSGGRS